MRRASSGCFAQSRAIVPSHAHSHLGLPDTDGSSRIQGCSMWGPSHPLLFFPAGLEISNLLWASFSLPCDRTERLPGRAV